MKILTKYFSLLIACLILPFAVFASESSATNFENSITNSVSNVQLRPLTSDAYDHVTDARTIGAGQFQLEGAMINYYFNSPTPRFYPSSEYVWDPRITVGLWTNVDLFVHPSYEIRNYDYKSGTSEFGRVNTGIKANLWGNESGTTAFGVMPYLSIPTHGGNVLGGMDVALLVRLMHGFYVKFDSDFYTIENGNDTVYPAFGNSMSINKVLCSKAEAYCYLDSDVTTESSQPWGGYAGFGLKYNFTNNLQIFAGMGFGLNSSSSYDYNPRLGAIWRF
jgi:hypothetical protein